MKQNTKRGLLSLLVAGILLAALVGIFGTSPKTSSAHAAGAWATNGQEITFSCSYHPIATVDVWGTNQRGVSTHWHWGPGVWFWSITTDNYWWVGTVTYNVSYTWAPGVNRSVYIPASGSGTVTVTNC